jgi:hypothetical protein
VLGKLQQIKDSIRNRTFLVSEENCNIEREPDLDLENPMEPNNVPNEPQNVPDETNYVPNESSNVPYEQNTVPNEPSNVSNETNIVQHEQNTEIQTHICTLSPDAWLNTLDCSNNVLDEPSSYEHYHSCLPRPQSRSLNHDGCLRYRSWRYSQPSSRWYHPPTGILFPQNVTCRTKVLYVWQRAPGNIRNYSNILPPRRSRR